MDLMVRPHMTSWSCKHFLISLFSATTYRLTTMFALSKFQFINQWSTVSCCYRHLNMKLFAFLTSIKLILPNCRSILAASWQATLLGAVPSAPEGCAPLYKIMAVYLSLDGHSLFHVPIIPKITALSRISGMQEIGTEKRKNPRSRKCCGIIRKEMF